MVYNTPPTSYLKYKSKGVEITLSFERAVVCNTLLQGLRARNIIIRVYAHFGRRVLVNEMEILMAYFTYVYEVPVGAAASAFSTYSGRSLYYYYYYYYCRHAVNIM